MAQTAFQSKPGPETQALFEKCALAQLEAFQKANDKNNAKELVSRVLSIKGLSAKTASFLIPLLPSFGFVDAAKNLISSLPEAERELNKGHCADTAIRLDQDLPSPFPEVKEGALVVRRAISLFDRGLIDESLSALSDIPRQSPFADWRLFLRGLAARRRGDENSCQENWKRLTPKRLPERIVRGIQEFKAKAAADPTPPTPSPLRRGPDSGDRQQLEYETTTVIPDKDDPREVAMFGMAISPAIRELFRNLNPESFSQFTRNFAPVRAALNRVDPKLTEKLMEAIQRPLCRTLLQSGQLDDGDQLKFENQLVTFCKTYPGPAYDPDHLRILAQLNCLNHDLKTSNDQLLRLRDQMSRFAPFSKVDRQRIDAIILRDLSQSTYAVAAAMENQIDEYGVIEEGFAMLPGDGVRLESSAKRIQRLKTLAVSWIDKAIEVFPSLPQLHKWNYQLHEKMASPESKMVEVLLTTLTHVPDDIESIKRLVEHYSVKNNIKEADRWIKELIKRAPLNPDARRMEYHHQLRMVQTALELNVVGAVREIVEPWLTIEPRKIDGLIHLALLERLLGNTTGANGWSEKVRATGISPSQELVRMIFVAHWYKTPKPVLQKMHGDLKKALAKKVEQANVIAIINFVEQFPVSMAEVPELEEVRTMISAYIKRSTRVKFTDEDFTAIIPVLGRMQTDRSIMCDFCRRAARQFRSSLKWKLVEIFYDQTGPSSIQLFRPMFLSTIIRLHSYKEPGTETILEFLMSQMIKHNKPEVVSVGKMIQRYLKTNDVFIFHDAMEDLFRSVTNIVSPFGFLDLFENGDDDDEDEDDEDDDDDSDF